jgi:ABC-type multidrug transport system ATPase subunit
LTTLSFDLVSHGELTRVSTAFASGSYVLLGTERDGTSSFLQLAAGRMLARSGRVTLEGKEPYLNAALRRQIAATTADERLPRARTVHAALRLALGARSDARSAQSVLDAAGLAHLHTRRTAELSAREMRGLCLALALTHPAPLLLALFEPLASLGTLSESFVQQAIERAAAAGAIVLTSASRIEDAMRLSGTVHALERGIWQHSPALLAIGGVALRVQTPEPQRLAARLSDSPDVSAVEWAGGRGLLVRGKDLERTAAHVVSSARAEAIRIEALRYEAPSLEALAAARAGLAHSAAEREHAAQHAHSEVAMATRAEPSSTQKQGPQGTASGSAQRSRANASAVRHCPLHSRSVRARSTRWPCSNVAAAALRRLTAR